MSIEFYDFQHTFYQRTKQFKYMPRKMWPEEFYTKILESQPDPAKSTSFNRDAAFDYGVSYQERDAYRWNRPYYKVFPSLMEPLSKIKLEIPPHYVKLPYPTIEVRFYKGNNLMYKGVEIKSVMFSMAPWFPLSYIKDLKVLNWIFVQIRADEEAWKAPIEKHTSLMEPAVFIPLLEGETVEEVLEEASQEWYHESKDVSDFFKTMMRILIGISFFSMDNHELIMPDLPRRVISAISHSKTQQEKDQRLADAMKKQPGFKVGKEIELPRPIVVPDPYKSEPTGRELQYSHLRSGHLRLQRYGSQGNYTYETIFIEPTVVRPDLPMGQSPGYKVVK